MKRRQFLLASALSLLCPHGLLKAGINPTTKTPQPPPLNSLADGVWRIHDPAGYLKEIAPHYMQKARHQIVWCCIDLAARYPTTTPPSSSSEFWYRPSDRTVWMFAGQIWCSSRRLEDGAPIYFAMSA
jgi:hypothetical protein